MCNLSDLIEKRSEDRGKELGKEIGKQLGIKSVAIEMLKDGMPVETVKKWNDEITLSI